ncbi:YdcH family protein [Halomonadaceae bacterium KBTZ08]
MSHTPHELAEEFPEHTDRISELKQSDAHFAELVDEYHEINRTIHRMETEIEPVATPTEEDARKKRLALKDEIAAYLNKETSAS